MDADLPIWRRCLLGQIFEQWYNQVLGIVVGRGIIRVPVRPQIEIGVESEMSTIDENTHGEIYSDDCPTTDDGS